MKDIFFHDRGKQILLTLSSGDKYVSEIASDVGATYAHTFNLIKVMAKQGIVTTNKRGRTKYVKLTLKGTELSAALAQFIDMINTPAAKFKKREKTRTKTKKKTVQAKTVEMAETATNRRLGSYADAMEGLLIKLKSEESPSELAKYARVIGRYRALVAKQRPRDQHGKNLKQEAIALVEELSAALELRRS
ncbi:MAG: winged helix-turn-helix domain-containing protein [Candidatus Hydrothermarchaeaceae archaeon]